MKKDAPTTILLKAFIGYTSHKSRATPRFDYCQKDDARWLEENSDRLARIRSEHMPEYEMGQVPVICLTMRFENRRSKRGWFPLTVTILPEMSAYRPLGALACIRAADAGRQNAAVLLALHSNVFMDDDNGALEALLHYLVVPASAEVSADFEEYFEPLRRRAKKAA